MRGKLIEEPDILDANDNNVCNVSPVGCDRKLQVTVLERVGI